MQLVVSIADARTALRELRAQSRIVGLVPTMGALHAGHLSLVRASRAQCDVTVATIFVNPTQFGPNEDLSKYPRTFDEDCRLLEQEGVALLFAPAAEEMYPRGASTIVEVEGISDRLDGVSRPGHFRGVATVVAKLFHILGPDRAFFGQKDAAQVAVLRKMVRDLNFPVEMIVCPTVREPDGLALSSRNRYLSPEERLRALTLRRALQTMEEDAAKGETQVTRLIEAGLRVISHEPEVRLDYLKIVDPDTLEEVANLRQRSLIAIAAWVGSTRLIDNTIVEAG
ncbi:pantoate--beta-alanine ligase [Silvibacterium bohemicum]|uniref:Pantothenate synthetase n=1 Tax=Silvibacterium bohemicum TaxID=1577686 RepID=A0A841K6E0_9BACT|nr:pantoate--beta-alanine ligase [Silvibacterium bohemicum]MBB6146148.1 pantoate--beta-alanine ligase [Silvibacterium bohemicum]